MRYSVWLTVIFVCLGCLLGVDEGHAVQSILVAHGALVNEIRLGMGKRDLLTALGAPSRIKSEGMCYQYESLDLSVFFSSEAKISRIYLGRDFRGIITKEDSSKTSMENVRHDMGSPQRREGLLYEPSPFLANKGPSESDEQPAADPGAEASPRPVEYRGNGIWYDLYSGDSILKSKYVMDDEGMALWLDGSGNPYAVVLYPCNKPPVPPIPVVQYLQSIHFPPDSSVLTRASLGILDRHAAFLKTHPELPFAIEGHADSTGSEAYNQLLSERRARSACGYLVQQGVSGNLLHCSGKGEHHPVADNRTQRGRAQNRRVEFRAWE